MQIPMFTTLGSGPTILMLHGIGGGHLAFAPQVESFAGAGYRAVAWDMPGYGRSAPIEPYNFKGLAASCIALIEALLAKDGRKSLILLGHSMGGGIVFAYGVQNADDYDQILNGMTDALEPRDFIEASFVKDMTDH